MSVEEFIYKREARRSYFRARNNRRFPCKVCGLYGCICQATLNEYINVRATMNKHRCPNCGLFLCDCPKDSKGKVLPVIVD